MIEGYPDWAVNIAVIKTILGATTLPISDDDLTSEALILPIFLQLDAQCPTWIDEDDPGRQTVYQIIVANLVGSSILLSQPKVTSSRMGDSSFTLGAGVDPMVFEDRAWQLLNQVCPLPASDFSGAIGFFKAAKGGRVNNGVGRTRWSKGLW